MKKILQSLSEFFIRHNWLSNVGKFKGGDKVKYNWKAKVTLGGSYNNKTHTITKIILQTPTSENFECGCDEGGGDVYWIRKLYFWER
jgi:hypothetical protein